VLPRALLILVALILMSLASSAGGATPVIDGVRDPVYGAPLVTQTTQTSQDDTLGEIASSTGWELDEGYGFISDGVLYVMLTGNMLLEPDGIEPGTVSSHLHVFIDCAAGGQNTLRSDNPYPFLSDLHGLTFDTDFAPDYWIGIGGSGGPDFSTPYQLYAQFAVLPADAPATSSFLGEAEAGGQHDLIGGANPFGIAIAIDNSNTGGVSLGCGGATGAGVTTGFECAIPLAAIGNPTGPIKVCALYQHYELGLSNQVLGPLPAGTCDMSTPSAVNFAAVAGNQYFVVPPSTAAVPPPVAASGLWLTALASPGRALTVRFELPQSGPARVDVTDVAGRRVLARSLAGEPGVQTIDLAPADELAPGVYFVRITQGASAAVARATVRR
jgi:hypothetical protein